MDDWPLAIAQVTPYPWGAPREVNEYVEHVADGLAQRGHRVLVLAASGSRAQVRDARREAAGGETFTEPLDLRIVIVRRGPCPRIGDEDLDAVGAAERSFLDRTLDARVPAPDVGAQDHA